MVHHAKKEHVDMFIIYGLALCLTFILFIIRYIDSSLYKASTPVATQKVDVLVTATGTLFNPQAFSHLQIEAKAYIVYDLVDQKIIASKNESIRLPLASVTKIMMALSSTLHAPHNAMVTISPVSIEDGYDLGLKNKQSWKLKELLKYTLIFSSNDGAEAVADSLGGKDVFVQQMNEDAKTFGLSLLFTDPAGRDMHGRIGGLGTALDVAKLFLLARKNIPEVLDATTKKRQTFITAGGKISGIPNTNQEIEDYGGIEASKTGYTDLAGGNLGIIVDISVGRPVVIVVLGSTKEGRFRDVNILYKALHASLKTK